VNDLLKQRLVGALILVALGVVFWPIIFVEPGEPVRGERSRIPAHPAVDTTPVEIPDLAGLRRSPETAAQQEQPVPEPAVLPPAEAPLSATDTPVAESAPAAEQPVARPEPSTTHTRSEAPEKPAMDSDGIPIAWILQVASVSTQEKADQLRKRLLARDYKAYVKRVSSNGRTLYRVCIGPKFERGRLEEIREAVDTEFGVKSLISRYVP